MSNQNLSQNLSRRGFMGMLGAMGAVALGATGASALAAPSSKADGAKASSSAADKKRLSGGEPLSKVGITYVTSPLNVPSIVEKSEGYFDDAFGKLGATVEYPELTSGADQTQALASGDVQFLNAVGATSVVQAAAAGSDVKVLTMYSRSPKAFSLYTKDDSLSSPEALKDKTVAGPVGTNLHQLLIAYLATAGMTIDDVQFANMSIPNAMAALEGGSIDVALIAGPTAYNAGKAGYHKVTDGEGLIAASIAVGVSDAFYQTHGDAVQAFLDAQAQALAFMKDHHEDTVQIVAKELGLDEQAVNDMYGDYDFSIDVTDEDKKGFKDTADFMLQAEMIKAEVDTDKLFLL